MSAVAEVPVCIQRLLKGAWCHACSSDASLNRVQDGALVTAISTMPPPMLSDSTSEAGWPELTDAVLRLQMLLLREHLQLACRFLLLNRDLDAADQINRGMEALLKAWHRAGRPLSAAAVEWVRTAAARTLPDVLSAQVDLYGAVGFGGLPPRMAVVLGMHRSGTSALTGMLARAGLDVPDDLMDRPDDEINLKGYWESEGLMQVNDQLFADFDLHWSTSDRLPDGWTSAPAAAAWRKGLIQQLRQTCRGTRHPVIKDPRLCILMGGMRPLIESDALALTFFLPIRHPLEVARSLKAAQGTELERGIALWIAHVRSAERQTRDQPRLILNFRDLMHQPETVLARCRGLLEGTGLGALSEQAAAFIDPSMQRQRNDPLMEELPQSAQGLLHTAMALHDALLGPMTDGSELHQCLDGITPVDATSG